MKKLFLILGFVINSLVSMDHQHEIQQLMVDPVQLKFKEKFFPSVIACNACDVRNSCKMYMNISSEVKIMGGISFADARRYACHHDTPESKIFMRYSNEFMAHVYNCSLGHHQAVFIIENNRSLMNYILTGKNRRCTSDMLHFIKESFKKAVREYN